ncbi:MBL fold metallo-hydrolase [Actinomyces polynesiensis]|uniref:MBL fold metallo-hydrolase n=1 Tax=Actinomyces polynesiensis TaxID=1325934 RepID=UPI0005B8DAB3|nr:MBL fold metallo-hydrolase [Actinomyces polynesiensis]
MHLSVIPTPFFGANCLVLVPEDGGAALVVDPSAGVLDAIRSTLDAHGVRVGAVLCTHGHPDHVWDAAEVASWAVDADEAPVWVPGPDLPRMDDPLSWVPMRPEGLDLVWRRPGDLRAVPAGTFEVVPGVVLLMVPAPGHTEGSAVFLGEGALEVASGGDVLVARSGSSPWALTGDVLFAGSVGRTDLPGGDEVQMRHTLRTLANAVDPETLLLPGHGPWTTMRRELATNPYVARARQVG